MAPNVDRISNLPDVLLLYIFYLLPSHDLLRISFLSTRFRYLWRSVPVLDVRENHYSPRCSLPQLMDYFFNIHQDLSIIRRFRLMCLNYVHDESDVHKWINLLTTVSCYRLQEFYLHLPSRYRFNLSRTNIFMCEKLETIGLYDGIVIREIPIGFPVLFPCLKTIRLRAISIGGVTTLSKLLSDCPRLKIFDARDCILFSERTIYPEIDVKKLYIKYNIKPDRSNECHGDPNRELSVASAQIDVNYNWGPTFDLLKPIFNIVKELEICNPRTGSWVDNEAVIWENLTHLVLKDHKYEAGFEALSFFLNRSPDLVSLVLEKDPPNEGGQINSVVLPNSWYYKLEEVKIMGFDGRREVENATWFLKNAIILKKLILCGVGISDEIKAKILNEPRASADCEIQFVSF